MEDIREHRQHYNDAKRVYDELAGGKLQLENVEEKIAEYEAAERKYEIRRILLLYQEMRWNQEHRAHLEDEIAVAKAKLSQLKSQLGDLNSKRNKALERKVNAENNELLASVKEITKSLENSIASIKNDIEKYKKALKELDLLAELLQRVMLCLEAGSEIDGREAAVIEGIASSAFNVDEKLGVFIKLKGIASEKRDSYNKDSVHISDDIHRIKIDLENLQEKITRLESDNLPFDKKYEDAKRLIKEELEKKNINTDVRLFAELVSNVDKEWQSAIETFLGKKRFDIVVDGKYCGVVMDIVHKHQLRDIKVVITDKLPKTEITPESAAAMLDIPNEYGRRYANYLLNGIHLCRDIEELHEYPKGGLMIDGTLAKSFTMSCMDIEKTQIYMGKDAVRRQLEKAKADKAILVQEEKKEEERLAVVKEYIADIEAVDWDET